MYLLNIYTSVIKGERGYNRQKLAELKKEIASRLMNNESRNSLPNKPDLKADLKLYASQHQILRKQPLAANEPDYFPNEVIDSVLAHAMEWARAEESDNSSIFSLRVQKMFENPMHLDNYIKAQERRQQMDGKTFRKVVEKGKSNRNSPHTQDQKSAERADLSSNMRQVAMHNSRSDGIDAEDPAAISRLMDNESRGISLYGSPREIVS